MKRLIKIQEIYQRLVSDKRIFRINSVTLDSRIQYLAIDQLKDATKHLKGEQKIEKMEELAA